MSGKAAAVAGMRWYHTLDLGDGIVTDGDFDLRDRVADHGIPADLSGMSVLDVGCSSGFWSFEFERRGARVTAIDIPPQKQDIWDAVCRDADAGRSSSGLSAPHEDAAASPFHTARRILGSQVDFREMSVYDLDPAAIGTFDLVFCGSVLMHLSDPFRALVRIASVARGQAVVSSVYFENGSAHPAAVFKLNPRSLWTPNAACLQKMMAEAGFRDVRVHGRITLRHARLGHDVPHLVLHGRK